MRARGRRQDAQLARALLIAQLAHARRGDGRGARGGNRDGRVVSWARRRRGDQRQRATQIEGAVVRGARTGEGASVKAEMSLRQRQKTEEGEMECSGCGERRRVASRTLREWEEKGWRFK